MPAVKVSDPVMWLEQYGVTLHDTGRENEAVCVCPFHDDSSPSCGVNTDKQVFFCPVCEAKGDLVDLAAGSMEVKRSTILAHLQSAEGKDTYGPVNATLITAWHNMLVASMEDLTLLRTRKGITGSIIKQFMLGKEGDRFTIPIPGEDGDFINVRKWSPLAKDRKKKVINMPGRGRVSLFPLKSLQAEGPIIITEGEFKALLLIQLGFNAITATGGAKNWDRGWNSRFKEKDVVLMFDVDAPGQAGAKRIAMSLHGTAKSIKVVHLPLDTVKYPTGDVTDYVVGEGMGPDAIADLIKNAEVWTPPVLQSAEVLDTKVHKAHLSQTSEARYYHKFVETVAVVSAKDTAPYIVPKVADIICPRDREYCALCPVSTLPVGAASVTIENKHPALLTLVSCPTPQVHSSLKVIAGIPRRCDGVKFEIKETQNVEELRLVPEVRIGGDGGDASSHVVRKAFYVGHGIDTNATFKIEALVVPEPGTQYATLLIQKAEASQDSLSTFQLSDEVVEGLSLFRPEEWTAAAVEAKLDEIYSDLEANVTRIYQRRDLHLFYDIIYHSPLYMLFQGRQVRGWMEGLVIGDSGQGKSETLSNMMRHYQVGEKIDSKGASVAGLLGGMQETARRWFVSWGIIPLNDKRLVALEEVKGMPVAVIEKLTDMRSSGIAELAKIEKARTNARTRLVWISNPRSDQQMSAYNFGVYAVRELIGALEDIRRFDMVISVSSGDVPSDVLNMRDYQRPQFTQKYTSELCRDCVLWAWSRKGTEVTFETDAIESVLQASEEIGKRYVSSIPIVEPADQRMKIARAAAAVAARTFSSDITNSRVIVRPCHVEVVRKFLCRIYNSASLGYLEYSKLVQNEHTLRDPDEVRRLLKSVPNARDVVRNLLEWAGFSIVDWIDVTEHDRDQARLYIGTLVRKNAIRRGRGGLYFKTPPFITMLRELEMAGGLNTESALDQVNKGEF